MQVQIRVVSHPKLKRDYIGRTVRAAVEMSNSYITIPAGKVGKVEYQGPRGSTLEFEACQCCGIKARITGVPAHEIEFVEIG